MVVMLQNVSAQDLKVKEIKPCKLTDVSYPRDFNDDFCALVLLKMPKGEVSFEGNIISNVSYIGDAYRIFLTKGTKYLNVKRKGANSLMINFSNFEISLQGGKCYQVVLEIPEGFGIKSPKSFIWSWRYVFLYCMGAENSFDYKNSWLAS